LKQRLCNVQASADEQRKANASYIDLLIEEHLPIPQKVKEIPDCLEYIIGCASKKGALLPLRVKTLLCETVWSSGVYNG
jgi:hypothetical protein